MPTMPQTLVMGTERDFILCVDDETDNLDALTRIFRKDYQVLTANSGKRGLELLTQHATQIAVIITDQRMPEMTGVEFLTEARKINDEIPRILLTGFTDMESIILAVNSGQIYRYLNKPWDPVDLQQTVRVACEKYHLRKNLEITNAKLATALEEVKSLDKAKTDFMILINHELKTPLTNLINFTTLLQETTLDEVQKKAVDRIDQSAQRLKELIHDSLIIVSAETKTLELSISPFFPEILDLALFDQAQVLMAQKQMALTIAFPKKRWIGDVKLLSQVLRRLIHNAIKFGANDSAIELSSAPISAHREKITVKNRGQQIPVQIQNKILRPFQLDEDIMKHSTGVGLGLTVCQAILKAHLSQLQFENLPDGVAISFELPTI